MSLRHVEGRIVVRVWREEKNWHQFEGGPKIRIERNFNNLNKRQTDPVNGTVVSAKDIPEGAELLLHHQATTDTYRIFNHGQLSGKEEGGEVFYYSIPEEQAFLWRTDGDWNPINGFATALQVFIPYTGILSGIDPIMIKDTLYITSGELAGNVCHTLKASNYCIVFQDRNGRENQIIRCRHYEGGDHPREELTCINHDLTKKVKEGKLLLGIDKSDAKILRKHDRKTAKKIA